MSALTKIGKGLERLGFPLLLLLLLWPPLFLQVTTTSTHRVSQEFLIVALGWLLIVVVGLGRALQGLPLLGGGEGSRARTLLIALSGWVLLSTVFAYHPAASLGYATSFLSFMLVAQTVLAWTSRRPERYRLLLIGLGLLVGMQVLLALAQIGRLPIDQWAAKLPLGALVDRPLAGGYWWQDFLATLGNSLRNGHPTGTLGNLNYLAEFLVLTLPVLAGWAMSTSKRAVRWVAGGGLMVAVLTLLATGTRAALLGLLVAAPLAALVVYGRSRLDPRPWLSTRRNKAIAAVALVTVLGVGALAGGRLISKMTANNGPNVAVESRLINWHTTALMWADRPLTGAGLGSFKLLNVSKLVQTYPAGAPYSAAQERFLQSHNEPLQALAELGLIGGLLAAGGGFFWVREVRRNAALPESVRFGLIWGAGALAVASCFGFPLHIPLTALVFLLLIALGLTAPARDAETALRPAWRPVYAALVALVVGIAGFQVIQKGTWPVFMANRYQFAANKLAGQRSPASAEVVYALADRHDRFRGQMRWYELQSLVLQSKFDEAIALFKASEKEGLGLDSYYWAARAYQGIGRAPEALQIYKVMATFYGDNHQMGKRAQWRIRQINRESPDEARKWAKILAPYVPSIDLPSFDED